MEEEGLVAALATWATNAEIQALFLVGCTCVGAWVLFKWIMQMVFHGVKSWYGSTQRQLIFWCIFVLMYFLAVMVFSTLWPFFVVVLILILMPSWRKTMVKDVVPRHLETIKYIGQKITNSSCNR